METAQLPTNQSSVSRPIGGIVCLVLSVPLFLGAVSWLGVLVLIDSHAEEFPKLGYVPGFVQIVVAALFALAGMLFIRRSSRAKVVLGVAIGSLAINLLLAVFFVASIAASA